MFFGMRDVDDKLDVVVIVRRGLEELLGIFPFGKVRRLEVLVNSFVVQFDSNISVFYRNRE